MIEAKALKETTRADWTIDFYGKEDFGLLPEWLAELAWYGPFFFVGPHWPVSNTTNDSLSTPVWSHWVAPQFSC